MVWAWESVDLRPVWRLWLSTVQNKVATGGSHLILPGLMRNNGLGLGKRGFEVCVAFL